MADTKLTGLSTAASYTPTDIIYFVDVSASSSEKIQMTTLFGGSQNIGGNLIMNSPGQIVTDGAEPQWWDDSSATITDEDASGEGIAEKQERVFKVVSSTANSYGYQTLTFADQDLLDAGQTVVSFGCWVYNSATSGASIGLYGTNLGLQESSQHSGGGSWEWLTVENQTLDAGDASIEARLIVDATTAYFCMPMLCVGPVARPWVARGMNFVPVARITQYDLNTTGDVAYSDTDCTANTDNLAFAIHMSAWVLENDGTAGSVHSFDHSDDVGGGDLGNIVTRVTVLTIWAQTTNGILMCNDSQIVRYSVNEVDADSDVRAVAYIAGYWMWA